jgi:hypothetical protein
MASARGVPERISGKQHGRDPREETGMLSPESLIELGSLPLRTIVLIRVEVDPT